MDYNVLLDKMEAQYQKQLPFVMYALPDSSSFTVYFQKDATCHTTEDFSEPCFVFAPFNSQEQVLCIPANQADVVESNYNAATVQLEQFPVSEDISEKKQYLNLVNAAIKTIGDGMAVKIVTSRKKNIDIKTCQLSLLIYRLLNLYPTAFRYLWYHPKTGLWCGASPEVLVKSDSSSFSTMALAATQQFNENILPIWKDKEREEQHLVTEAISTALEKVAPIIKVSKTYNHQAGSLVHLRTDITGIFKNKKSIVSTLVAVLHPTPAVCGTPQNCAKEFIFENEQYNRAYYTGFLGPIHNKNHISSLFVNLRCMSIEGNIASLYVGGGITGASNPDDEWEETQNKLQTMLHVLQPLL